MLVFKLILAVIIVGITTYIGYSLSTKLRKREETLRECVTFFNLVENEIKYNLTILPNAYEISRQKLKSDLNVAMAQIVQDILENDNYALTNQSIVKNIDKIRELTSYDKNLIISTLKNLGRSDLDSQINILENSKNLIIAQIEEALNYKNKNSKLYRVVGTIVGVMIVIVLI